MEKTANRWLTVLLLTVFLSIVALAAGHQGAAAPSSVLVTNGNTQSIPVHDTIHGKDVLQLYKPISFPDGASIVSTTLSAIPGERLVITNVSGFLDSTDQLLYVSLKLMDSHNNLVTYVALPCQITSTGGAFLSSINSTTLIYIDPSQHLDIFGVRNSSTGSENVSFSVSGYRVSLP
jgi:hypothetical protein